MGSELLWEELIGKFTCLLESVDFIRDFKVYPPIEGKTQYIILVNYFLWNDAEFETDVFLTIKGCAQVEVPKIGGGEFCIGL